MVKNERHQEEQYLADVYRQLQERQVQLEELLEQARSNGIQDIQTLMGDVRLNYSNISDNLDTYAALEMKNREIDQMNIRLQTAVVLLKKIERLLEVPYFGKITVDFLEEEQPEAFYIGVNGFANELGEYLVYDWRSPIAELFYNNEMGPSSYRVNRETLHVELKQRRQLIVEADRLLNFFDTSISIQDDVLLEVLGNDATSQMQDITSTIQKEQNVIIRDTAHRHLLVNGVAGSGKTSTIMQRIAYLLFQYREQMTSEDVMILSPNRQFVDYISDVLPSLGEANPDNVTFLQFINHHLHFDMEDEAAHFERISQPLVSEQVTHLRSEEFSKAILTADALFKQPELFMKPLIQQGKVVISRAKLVSLFNTTPSDGRLIDRIQATKQLLRDEWEQRLSRQARKPEMQDQVLSLSEESQEKYFGSILTEKAEKNIYAYTLRLLKKKYKKITRGIERNQWLDLPYFFKTIYESKTGEAYPFRKGEPLTVDEGVVLLLIRHTLVERLEVPRLKFLFIDEIQDYTPAQLYLLKTIFGMAKYTMVGDENQSIFNAAISFAQIDQLFEEGGSPCHRYDLLSSYRPTGAITDYFGQLASVNQKWSIVPIREVGALPVEWVYRTDEEWLTKVEEMCAETTQTSLVILTKQAEEAEHVKRLLQSSASHLDQIKVLPITLAKGLEFDNILIYNASQTNYHTDRERRMLYTMASRAMRQLFISYHQKRFEF
ncbi:MAG: HelD family protein [Vagococcus sp.]